MILISDLARAVLWITLENCRTHPQDGMRVSPSMDGFALDTDRPTESDRVIQHNGSPVIIIDQRLDREIKDLLIDVSDGPEGLEVVLQSFPGQPRDTCLWIGQDYWSAGDPPSLGEEPEG